MQGEKAWKGTRWHTGVVDRSFFMPDALSVAPRLLGSILSVDSPQGLVGLRITETEAYLGVGSTGPYDPGSHSKDRKTARNASMFLPPGHAYVYFTYGMHFALNLVCSQEHVASGVLIRSGQIVQGLDLARERRHAKQSTRSASNYVKDAQLARGPGNLAAAMGITRESHDGLDLLAEPFHIVQSGVAESDIARGPRVGVAGVAGGPAYPWRFWLKGDPTVSAFRPGRDAPVPPAKPRG
ncbi:DNA-3-methyladenine glycosidase [Glutamicibacter halophytocola]|nr:DNA-3-methyladenine glycosidase [Glutamicibacter halophytocola]